MQLNIIKPMEKKVFEILWIDFKTPVGEFVIQQKHAPMVASLAKDSKITYCLSNGVEQFLLISEGIVHVTRKDVTLLVNN